MTATIKTNTYKNGWNAVVKALESGDSIEHFATKIADIQASYNANHGLFHYAQGAKDCLAKYEEPGVEIPDKLL
jgi:hypothetical protein